MANQAAREKEGHHEFKGRPFKVFWFSSGFVDDTHAGWYWYPGRYLAEDRSHGPFNTSKEAFNDAHSLKLS